MSTGPEAKIYLVGSADDLYMLSLLFPAGAYRDLHIVSSVRGAKDGIFDRVTDASETGTYVTGEGALAVMEGQGIDHTEWIARELLAPLNGYAVLADPNFRGVRPSSVNWTDSGRSSHMVFNSAERVPPSRLIAATWSPLLSELRGTRVDFMVENPLAAYAAAVIGGRPSWADYYRLLEDIAGYAGTTLDKLDRAGLAAGEALQAFKKAANQRAFGRHGTSKRDIAIPQDELMNLLEAREFVRNVVSAWLDAECGGRLPRNRVDGGPLRFGLDDHD